MLDPAQTPSVRDECEHGSLRRKCELCQRDADIKELRDALVTAQGEAYLGTLAGDDTPDPLAACHNVIRACRDALAGWTV